MQTAPQTDTIFSNNQSPIKSNILEAIGNTPLVELHKVPEPDSATVYAKCEYMNPAGSIKDRMAFYIISRAEQEGLLKPGGTIVENTSGNTGMGAAMVAAVKGYKAVFTMPDKMSQEKIDGLRAYGAQVIITPTDVPGDSPDHYVNVAKRVAEETPNSFYMDQYHSQWNIDAHELSTGKELYEQTGGDVDAIVIGTGTGGSVSGIGRYFKKMGSKAKIIGVDPLGSVHYHFFHTGTMSTPYVYKVEGLGEDILCKAFDTSVVDEMYQVNDYECFTTARRLTREEGIFCGGSSGGMVHIACKIAKEMGPGKKIIAICPDSGTRYVTKYLSDEWMKMHGFMEPEKGLGVIEDLIDSSRNVVTVCDTDSVDTVIEALRSNGISQVPVVDGNGKPNGIVHEVDILRGLQDGSIQADSKIAPIAHEIAGVLHPKARVEELYGIFETDHVAIVIDGTKIMGVVSKIDLIEHLTKLNA
ncbi:MAG: pyridoxal-phosphate dependent enzyme [Phycisphaerales bacterium]|nr:pyridoxal-phosphate dependent enzyme [Phycisphaerales bacterium]